jgi:hypothetical protein
MHDALWSDDELRTFLTDLSGRGLLADEPDPELREAFLRQARLRLVVRVQQRLLADIGTTVDPSGVAHVAYEILEDGRWTKAHTWLMVTTDPWSVIADLVFREIRSAYRATVGDKRDDKRLDGIRKASTRLELPAGADDGDSTDDAR